MAIACRPATPAADHEDARRAPACPPPSSASGTSAAARPRPGAPPCSRSTVAMDESTSIACARVMRGISSSANAVAPRSASARTPSGAPSGSRKPTTTWPLRTWSRRGGGPVAARGQRADLQDDGGRLEHLLARRGHPRALLGVVPRRGSPPLRPRPTRSSPRCRASAARAGRWAPRPPAARPDTSPSGLQRSCRRSPAASRAAFALVRRRPRGNESLTDRASSCKRPRGPRPPL